MKYRVISAALAAFFVGLIATGASAQQAAPAFDQRTVGQQLKALSALVDLREAEIRAIAADMKALDANWRAEFKGWCGDRPACGLEAKPAEPAK